MEEYLTYHNIMGFVSISLFVGIGSFFGSMYIDKSPQKAMISLGCFVFALFVASTLSGEFATLLNTLIYHTDITPILDLLLRRTLGLLFMIFSDSDNNAITFLFYVSFLIITVITFFLSQFLVGKIDAVFLLPYKGTGKSPYFVGLIMGFVAVSMITSALSKISVVDQRSEDSNVYTVFKESGNFLITVLGRDLIKIKRDYKEERKNAN